MREVFRRVKSIIKSRFPGLVILKRRLRFYFVSVLVFTPRDFCSINPEKIIRLGSDYGGWHVLHRPSLNKSFLISGGAGEDISFDIEFVSRYQAKAVILDPTPRAIDHFESITRRFGLQRSREYNSTGRQSADSYDLTRISSRNLQFVAKALWNSQTKMKFYSPGNPEFVSHTLLNIAKAPQKYIEVETISIAMMLHELEIGFPSEMILKLDIEGAEYEVLLDMLDNSIQPSQILLEYDGMNSLTKNNIQRIRATNKLLKQMSYSLRYTNYISNFLYLRNDISS